MKKLKKKLKNIQLLDSDIGIFSVLDIITLHLSRAFWWVSKDIDEELVQGAVFHCYDEEATQAGGLDLGFILVVDATLDASEPNIPLINPEDMTELDKFLHQDIKSGLDTDGMTLIEWIPSNLNQGEYYKELTTTYIVLDQGKKRQFFAQRFSVKGRKMVVIGAFDIAKKDELEVPIISTIKNIKIL